MRWQRLWVAMLVPGGLAIGHEAGCSATRSCTAETTGWLSHSCLLILAVVGLPLAATVIAAAFSAGMRGRPAGVRASSLAVAQGGIFLLVELLEHLMSGAPVASVVGERAVWLGLAAQLVVAFAVTIVMRAVTAVGAWLAQTGGTKPRYRKTVAATAALLWTPVLKVDMSAACRRGPPLLRLS